MTVYDVLKVDGELNKLTKIIIKIIYQEYS